MLLQHLFSHIRHSCSVSEVISGGGAEKAGITKGAVITGIEGTTVDGMDALQEQLQ